MPLVTISNLPRSLSLPQFRHVREEWRESIAVAVASILELGLIKEDVVVRMVPDMMEEPSRHEIIVEIAYLINRPLYTFSIKNRLAESVGKAVQTLYPKAKIMCFVTSFISEKEGRWSSE